MRKYTFAVVAFITFSFPALAADKRVKVINESAHTILRVQASSTDNPDYGEVLNATPIAPGEWQILDLDDGAATCMYDIRSQSRGNVEATQTLDACHTQSWTVHD